MFKAFVLVCAMSGAQECNEYHNPQLFNKTEDECIVKSLEFIEYLYSSTDEPIMVSYRCEYHAGV